MKDVDQEFSVLAAPVAPNTWQVGPTILTADVAESGFVKAEFSRPIEVLGIKAAVIPVLPLAGGFPSPTIADIDVLFELDQQERYTSNATDGQVGEGFVPLEHLVTDAVRLMRLVPGVDAPDLLFKFAWRQFLAGAPKYQGAIISLSLLTRYVPKMPRG